MAQATKLSLDNVSVPSTPFDLLPVPPPGPDAVKDQAKPGFPLNGSRTVEIHLLVNSLAVAVPTVSVKYHLFDDTWASDGVNYGPLPPGTPVRISLKDVVAEYLQVELSGFGAPTVLDFVRVAGR